MVGVSVHGLLGVDADLQRSAFAAQEYQQHQVSEYHSFHVDYRGDNCHKSSPEKPSQRT